MIKTYRHTGIGEEIWGSTFLDKAMRARRRKARQPRYAFCTFGRIRIHGIIGRASYYNCSNSMGRWKLRQTIASNDAGIRAHNSFVGTHGDILTPGHKRLLVYELTPMFDTMHLSTALFDERALKNNYY